MRNITLFTVPRHFKPSFKMIQYNAIRSWLLLDPTPEIILCGNDEGVVEAAVELGVSHIPNVELSSNGTPLVNSVFNEVQSVTKNTVLAYINSDIILTNDFLDTLDTVTSVLRHRFMIVGQRWDLEVNSYIDFSDSSWESKLRKEVAERGKLHPPCGIDYHIFEKGIGMNMPPFVVGRPCWDMWFMSKAIRTKLDIVDATEKTFIVHQKHDYSHIGGVDNSRKGEEAMVNHRLAGNKIANIKAANWRFQNDKLVKK